MTRLPGQADIMQHVKALRVQTPRVVEDQAGLRRPVCRLLVKPCGPIVEGQRGGSHGGGLERQPAGRPVGQAVRQLGVVSGLERMRAAQQAVKRRG